jgi:AraC-like DNA-binding protein
MALEPLLTVRALRPLLSGLEAMGHDPFLFLNRIGVRRLPLDDPDAQVPMRLGVGLLARACADIGDENLGLHLAQRAALTSVDVHFYAMAASRSLGAAYQRLCRYQRLINDTSLVELSCRHGRAVLRHRLPQGAAPRQSAEFILASWVRAGRVITGVEWRPAEVRFAHPPPLTAREHREFFRAPVLFASGENAIEFDEALMDLPCVRADSTLADVLDRFAGDRLNRIPPGTSLARRVRALLELEFRGGEPTAHQCARHLRMSVRTLNRQLAAEQTTFRDVADGLRHELAAQYLTGHDVAIAEIAFLLGFSELSSFHRAFKRWTGATPAQFRQRQHASRLS